MAVWHGYVFVARDTTLDVNTAGTNTWNTGWLTLKETQDIERKYALWLYSIDNITFKIVNLIIFKSTLLEKFILVIFF